MYPTTRRGPTKGSALLAILQKLLLLSAYRVRIFRYPPPLRIVPEEILDAFPALECFVEKLQQD